MFFSRDKEKFEDIPVEILHKSRNQKKKKQLPGKLAQYENLHTTESIISGKVKKYLYKLFGSSKLAAILESPNSSSRSSSTYKEPKESKFTSTLEQPRSRKVNFPEKDLLSTKHHKSRKPDKYYKLTKKMSASFRKNKKDTESLNNLFNMYSKNSSWKDSDLKMRKKIKLFPERVEFASSVTSKNILKELKSNSFCEIVDNFIKKQRKKHPRSSKPNHKKLKKTTKSSISTMCERAKFLLNHSFMEETPSKDLFAKNNPSMEEQEETRTINDLGDYDPLKSSEESFKIPRNKSLESLGHYSKGNIKYKCSGKISSCTNIHHSSKLDRPFYCQDFDADLEIWTADYIRGLVATCEPKSEIRPISKIPVKKKCKPVKTKSKKYVKSDVKSPPKNDGRLLMDSGRNSNLLGGVKTMEGHQKYAHKQIEGPKLKTSTKKDDIYTSQRVQDIQNYIDKLMGPEDVDKHQKTPKHSKEICVPGSPKNVPKNSKVCPEKQSIQELKKFQRELRQRIKELEKKMPSTSSAFAKQYVV